MQQPLSPEHHTRDDLIREHLPLARRLAARYRNTSEPLEDLTQVAYMGLVLAADRYDAGRATSFKSFAIPTILGELRRHIRDHGWAARVPRSLQEDLLRVTAVMSELSGSLGRSPSPREVSEGTGLSTTRVLEAMEASSAYQAESLDQSTGDSDESREPLIATLGREDPGYEIAEYGASIGPAAAELSAQERTILAMRFFEDRTQSDIAKLIGVSQMQVSRVLRRAVDHLQKAAA